MKNLKTLPVLLVTFYFMLLTFNSRAQNIGINATGATPDESALLDLNATDKGFLITRADTLNIASPAFGLMTLAPIDSCLYMYSGAMWISLGGVGDNCPHPTSTTPPLTSNCGDPFTDARDNETYGTVQIGNQCWMSENLNYTPSPGNSACYDNDPAKCSIYGRLYDWNTASNGTSSTTNPSGVKGVCPVGWHLPSDEEWKELEMHLGMNQADADGTGWRGTDEGEKLKVISFGGTNSSGYNALPGGRRMVDNNFTSEGANGYWWSSTEDGINALQRYLFVNNKDVSRNSDHKDGAYSVRCVRD